MTLTLPSSIACLNGQFAPLNTLQVSVMDRGFLFGDSVYELILVCNRYPFRLHQHLVRLERSLAEAGIPNPYRLHEWNALITELIARQDFGDQSIYLQVSRGPVWPREFVCPEDVSPTTLIYAEPFLSPPNAFIKEGIHAVSAADIRWLRCNIKSCSLIASVLLKQQAEIAGVEEVILFRDGLLTEGGSSNIFVVKDGVLLTPPPSSRILAGITYDIVLEIAKTHGFGYQIREIPQVEVRVADELWLTSSNREVLAIVELDGHPIGNGKPGPIFRQIYPLYQQFKMSVMRAGKDIS